MSPQDAFEAYVKLLYRRWYGFPLHSSRQPLDARRLALANELVAAPDPKTAAQSFLDFVRWSRALPGVMAQLSADRRAEEVLGSNGVGLFLNNPNLKPSLADPQALATTLSQRDPALWAVRQQFYVDGEKTATLAAVRAALEPLSDFDAADQAQIEALLAAYDAAGNPAKAEETLLALEEMDDVIIVAWRAILAGKAYKRIPKMGGEMSAMPVVLAAPEPQVTAAPAGVTTSFFTDVRFPRTVKLWDVQPLFVRLTLNQDTRSITDGEVSVEFPDPKAPELITVRLFAPGFIEEYQTWERTLIAFSDRNSEPVGFLLKADAAGKTQFTIDFFKDDRQIGTTNFQVEVVASGQTATANVEIDGQGREMNMVLTHVPPPADLELRVIYVQREQMLHYLLHSTKSAVDIHWESMGSTPLNTETAAAFFEETFAFLDELSEIPPEDLSDAELLEFSEKIENAGEKLFERLFSPELQDVYWDILALHEEGVINSFLITSDEPWIPWELVKPYKMGRRDKIVQRGGFLGETFQLSRWLSGRSPREQLHVKAARVIVPDTDLAHTRGEGQDFDRMKTLGVEVSEPIATKAALMEVIRAGAVQLLHFATHAAFDSDRPHESPIELDENLIPEDLTNRVIEKLSLVSPIIFLNACQTGRMGFQLNGLDGWAERFVRKVHATAFVGTLWEVNDALAAQFAAKFYAELFDGNTLGVAFQRARLHIKTDANPTWLAYALYGDPNTTVRWGDQPER
ncbi:MAG: CHAT domain-containing protein [Caldilineaceae bacterium]|nr:CHAT domain-containing protein [Caldilineaceae bacterium]